MAARAGLGPVPWLLVAFLAAQPGSTDIYLPALPALGAEFSASTAQVQLTLSVFIGGFAVAQLLAGPLSDRFGRRPVALGGAILFVLALIGVALAPNMHVLVAMRFVQALGVCCLVVCARAIVRDRYVPSVGAQVMARIMARMGLAPLLGPPLAGLCLPWLGWRGLFGMLAVFAMILLIISWRTLEESNQRLNPEALSGRQLIGNYLHIGKHPEFWAYALTGAASYCALFSFISGSPYLVIEVYGYSPAVFGLVFSSATMAFIVGTVWLGRMLPRYGAQRIIIGAASLSCACGLAMALLAWTVPFAPAAMLVPMLGIMLAHGMINASAQVAVLGPFPAHAGAAAALNGFQMHVWGALVGLWTAWTFDGSVLPFALTTAAITSLLAVFAHTLVRRHGALSDAGTRS